MGMLLVSFSDRPIRHGRTWYSILDLIAVLPRPARGGNSLWYLLIYCPRSCFSSASFSACPRHPALLAPAAPHPALPHRLPGRLFAIRLPLFSSPLRPGPCQSLPLSLPSPPQS